MSDSGNRALLHYGAASATVAVAFLVRWLLHPALGEHHPYGTFVISVLISAWYLGTGPAVWAVISSALLSGIFFVPPPYVLAVPEVEHQVGLALFLLVGATGIYASQVARREADRADAHRRLALEHQGELQAKIAERERAEKALRESEERFRHLAQAMPQIVWTADPSGVITFMNEQWEEYTGLTLEETRQIDEVREVVHPEDVSQVLERWQHSLATGEPHEAQWRFKRRSDGTYRWFLTRAVPIRDEHDRIREWFGTATDIHDQKRTEVELRQSERLYRAIGESINYGIWVCDPEGRNIYASESFLNLVGITQEECSNFGWGRVLHPDDAEATMAAWKECSRKGDFWEREHRFHGVDGKWHDILARGVPIRNDEGEILCWAGINLDIGALKEAQQGLRDADRRKDEFLATLAHELRNPLAPLRHGLEILKISQGDPQTSVEIHEMMGRQLGQLVRLVDDLLDVSRITRGKIGLRRERVNLADAIHSAVETIQPTLEGDGHELLLELPKEPIYLYADPTRLSQVFFNLLSNACRYTDGAGRIRVTTRQADSMAIVSIQDCGVGIPAESLEYVFEMFSQVDRSLERRQGGLGIGLSLVQGIVELHGGTVEAESDGEGLGSTFTVRLPLNVVEGDPMLPDPASGLSPAMPRRILVVDDNQDAADSLALLLRSAGHTVHTSYDGQSALAIAAQFQPEFILLDIGMPGMNGYEVAGQVRRATWGTEMVLVATTGWGQPDDKRQAAEAGFDVHLTKPVDITAVTAILRSVKNARAQQPEIAIAAASRDASRALETPSSA